MEIKKNSEIIPQNIGSGGVLRIVPPKRGKVIRAARFSTAVANLRVCSLVKAGVARLAAIAAA